MRGFKLTGWAVLTAALLLAWSPWNPRNRRRAPPIAARSAGAMAVQLGPIVELFDSNDRDNSAASYRNYRHQPTIVRDPISGDLVAVHRAGGSHSGHTDAVAVIRSGNEGLSWSDRRTEVTIADNILWQEIEAISAPGRTGEPNRLWLSGTDVDVDAPIAVPSRECWTIVSDDGGVSWVSPNPTFVRPSDPRKTFNVPRPGSNFTTCTANTGVFTASDGTTLLMPAYGNDVGQTRYVAWMFRSTDGGLTWTVGSTIADHGPTGTRQYEEPGCLRRPGTATVYCLLRVDNDPPSGVDPNRGTVFFVTSLDDGATWSAPVAVFQGRGTTPLVLLTNGTLVAMNRSRGTGVYGATEGFRGEIWYSTDSGVTWSNYGDVTNPLDGPDDMRGGPYMGAGLLEVRPNVVGAIWGQETAAPANAWAGLYYRELGFGGAAVSTPTDRSTAALFLPSTGGVYLDYGPQTILSGVSRAVVSLWFRKLYYSGVPWVAADEALLSRNVLGGRHFDLRLQANRRAQVIIGTSATTVASWTSNTDLAVFNNGQATELVVVFDGTQPDNARRLQIVVNGINITALGTFSGTIPATLTSPSLGTWQIGAAGGANTARSIAIDEVAIWTGVRVMPDTIGEVLWNRGIPARLDRTELGTPPVWLRFEGSTATNSGTDTNWNNPTVTGTPQYATRLYASRYAPPHPVEDFRNVSGVRRNGGSQMSRAVAAGSDIDAPAFTVCAKAIGPVVEYEALAYRQCAGDESFYLLGDPVPYGTNTWTAGLVQPNFGMYADIAYYDTTGAHSICLTYAPRSPVGDGRIWVDGVDRTIYEPDGVTPTPVFAGNFVPPAQNPNACPLNVANTSVPMDTLTFYNCALSEAEVLAWHCVTTPLAQRGAECAAVTTGQTLAILNHPCFVDRWDFDVLSNLGRSFTGTHDLGGEAFAQGATALP